jgi:hypothetical protein
MKKILSFFVIMFVGLGLAFVFLGDSEQKNQDEVAHKVSTKNGETLFLTSEELALSRNQGEKKIVLTDLGMF